MCALAVDRQEVRFDADGKPAAVRNFLAYEADKGRAVELVRKRLPVREGEQAT